MKDETRTITVTVNGTKREAEVEPRELLVYFLRDHLGLTGTHVGCDTSQCGACTPGMIMSAVYMLKSNPSPSEEQIRHALEGNLCRCTGYVNIIEAVKWAAGRMRGDHVSG